MYIYVFLQAYINYVMNTTEIWFFTIRWQHVRHGSCAGIGVYVYLYKQYQCMDYVRGHFIVLLLIDTVTCVYVLTAPVLFPFI